MKTRRQTVATSLAMQALGGKVARAIAAEPVGNHAKVVALIGDLGVGKTTFAQGFLKTLGVKRRVISPTFLIIRPYVINAGAYTRAVHIDCYRLHKPEELVALGLRDILRDPTAIVLIEWPELVKKFLPRSRYSVRIEHPKKGAQRSVTLVM